MLLHNICKGSILITFRFKPMETSRDTAREAAQFTPGYYPDTTAYDNAPNRMEREEILTWLRQRSPEFRLWYRVDEDINQYITPEMYAGTGQMLDEHFANLEGAFSEAETNDGCSMRGELRMAYVYGLIRGTCLNAYSDQCSE